MANTLLDKLKAAGTVKTADVLRDSTFFSTRDMTTTDLPILNIAFSGELTGGLISGLTILAGESKTFKTLLALYCMNAYLTKHKDAVAILWDSEFGITPEYLASQGIDTSRVIHVPIEHVEQLKFDIVKRLEAIKRGDKVFLMLDSLGALASKKETDDAMDEKSVADMSRAKAIRSLFRIITPHLTTKDLPCVVINHIYKTMELYSKNVVGGGTSVMYSANQIFIITRSQEQNSDKELVGYNFTINIEKSRFVREKSKMQFQVTFDEGIDKWSGLLDIAQESGHVVKPSNGWYAKVDTDTGEVDTKKWREAETHCKEFWLPILTDSKFNDFIKSKYQLAIAPIEQGEEE